MYICVYDMLIRINIIFLYMIYDLIYYILGMPRRLWPAARDGGGEP